VTNSAKKHLTLESAMSIIFLTITVACRYTIEDSVLAKFWKHMLDAILMAMYVVSAKR